MDNFIVNVNETKNEINLFDDIAIVNGKEFKYSVSYINEYSFHLRVDNKSYEISMDKNNKESFRFLIKGSYYETTVRSQLEEKANETLSKKEKLSHKDKIIAPMPGLVIKFNIKVGDEVTIGDSLVVLEAMKMENDIKSTASGIVKSINASEGDSVEKGEILIVIE